MNPHIPLVDIASQQAEIADAMRHDLDRILSTASFVGGPDVARFEEEYARFVGVGHCVSVANGTDAVELALRALAIGPADEVVIPANTFIATAEAVVRVGATPVLVDVTDETLLIDPAAVAAALTPRTRAVVAVHLYGQMAPVEELAAILAGTGVALVEDAAQSQGASQHGVSSGAAGRIAATSFYPGKNLGAAGDAGAVTTDDPDLARMVRLLANHGSERKYVHEVVGFNSRLDTIQAAVLRHKLRRLEAWNARRREVAARYSSGLATVEKVQLPVTAPGNVHAWHLYVVRVPNRDGVLAALRERGVGAGIHYPYPLHLTEAFAGLPWREGDFPIAERAASEILSLPMYPHLNDAQIDYVVETFSEVSGGPRESPKT